jgi:hypothetical protein
MHRMTISGRLGAIACCALILAGAPATGAEEARLVPVKLGLYTLSLADRASLWKRVDEWATADSLLDFCGTKLNIYVRAWKAVTACVDTPSLRKVGTVFRAKRSNYLKILQTKYAEAEQKKAFCDGLGPQLKEYARIINLQIAEADGMCRACLWC